MRLLLICLLTALLLSCHPTQNPTQTPGGEAKEPTISIPTKQKESSNTPVPSPTSSPTEISPLIITSAPYLLVESPAREYHPKWSNSGEILGFVSDGVEKTEIWFQSAEGSDKRLIDIPLDGDLAFVWSADDKSLLFDAYDETGFLSIFTTNLETIEPIQISEQGWGKGNPCWSPDNSQAAYVSETDIWILPMDGAAAYRLTTTNTDEWHPYWSPDGSKMIFTSDSTGNADLWVLDIATGETTQLTTNETYDDRGIWSPDGEFIIFVSDRSGSDDIWLYKVADGSEFQITDHPGIESMPSWHPDGKSIVFMAEFNGNWDIWGIDLFE